MPGSSQSRLRRPAAAPRAPREHRGVERRRRGIGDQGRDMSHAVRSRQASAAGGGAYRRPDRQRQVGAGARARRAARRRRRSTPIPCRSIAICASSRRGPSAGGGGARAASCCTAMSTRPRTIRSGAGAPMSRPRSTSCRGEGRLPILVGGTGLYFKALTQGLSAVPPTPPDIRAAVRARCDAEGRGGAACRARAPRSGDRRAAQARRPDAHRPRARGAGGDRPFARRLAPRRHAGDARSRRLP